MSDYKLIKSYIYPYKTILIVFSAIFYLQCGNSVNYKEKNVVSLSSFLTLHKSLIENKIIERITNYINEDNLLDSDVIYKYWNKQDNCQFQFPGSNFEYYFDLISKNESTNLYVKGIRKLNDSKYKVGLSVIDSKLKSLIASFSIYVVEHDSVISFVDPVCVEIEKGGYYSTDKLNRVKFVLGKGSKIEEDELNKLSSKLSYFDKFFNFKPNFIIISAANSDGIEKLRGFEYNSMMYRRFHQEAGIYDRYNKIIFSGNGSYYYLHELVHVYTSKYNCHKWFDEGIATYFGGNVNRSIEELISKVNNLIENGSFVIPEEVTKLKFISTNLKPKYVFGGLLMKIAMEELRGREDVLYLLNQGKSDKDFYRAVKNVFGIDKQKLKVYLESKIKQYSK